MRILVSNDDGVHSDGLRALVDALLDLGHVTVVAPDRERSAVGHSLTFFHPVRVHKLSEDARSTVYSSDGTPTDCVLLAIFGLMKEAPPDLVVSGINRGANLGDDLHYSGTVSAAMEAAIHGVASFSVSLASFENMRWDTAAAAARRVADAVIRHGLPPRSFLNVNVPNVAPDELRGWRTTVQGTSIYQQSMIKRHDPRGNDYYWISGAIPRGEPREGTDFAAIQERCVSVTPVQLNLTHREYLDTLSHWSLFDAAQTPLA